MVAFIVGNSDPSSPIRTMDDMPAQQGSCREASTSGGATTKPQQPLIPGIPDDMARKCLARVPFWFHGRCKVVSKGWQRVYSDPELLASRQAEGIEEEYLLCIGGNPSVCPGQLYFPQAGRWRNMPPTPVELHSYGLENFGVVAYRQHVFVIGGVLYDSRSYPSDFPVASTSVYRYDFVANRWCTMAPMIEGKGSVACAVSEPTEHQKMLQAAPKAPGMEEEEDGPRIYVAGGDGRYTTHQRRWSHLSTAEVYDVKSDTWAPLPSMTSFRAGGSGVMVGDKFVVLGGYGTPRLIAGFLQVSEQCQDSEVFSPKAAKWSKRRLSWFPEDKPCTGPVAKVGEDVFMLLGADILKLELPCDVWCHEASLEWSDRDAGFFALHGELHVVPSERVAAKHQKHYAYNPRTKTWSTSKMKSRMRYLRQHQACKQPFKASTSVLL